MILVIRGFVIRFFILTTWLSVSFQEPQPKLPRMSELRTQFPRLVPPFWVTRSVCFPFHAFSICAVVYKCAAPRIKSHLYRLHQAYVLYTSHPIYTSNLLCHWLHLNYLICNQHKPYLSLEFPVLILTLQAAILLCPSLSTFIVKLK